MMLELIRTVNGRTGYRPRLGVFVPAVYMAISFNLTVGTSAMADISAASGALKDIYHISSAIHLQETALVLLIAGLTCFSVLATVNLLRARRMAKQYEVATRHEIDFLHAEIDRLNALLFSEPQVLVTWSAGEQANILGDISLITLVDRPKDILLFDQWLESTAVQTMEEAIDNLRNKGQGFEMEVVTAAGQLIGAEGRAIGGTAILRLYDVRGIKRKLSDTLVRYNQLKNELETMKGLLEILPAPVWVREISGRLSFVNTAYARAVEAGDPHDAIARGLELFDHKAHSKLTRATNGQFFAARIPAIAAGKRRIFDVLDQPSGLGFAGIAIDCTEVENMRGELTRTVEAHRRVLDQLVTGVAVFNSERKLIFHNAAFRSLFDLDAEFLDQTPSDAAVLELLRSRGKLPEQQNFREWKKELHEAYRAIESRDHMWHLPDGRTLRVVTAPNPEGGITYIYEDVTEKLDMHRRFDALIKVQRETLDHLTEAVVVFGSDGCVRLHNPAFQRMWKLSAEILEQGPHVDAVAAWCEALHVDSKIWRAMRAAVTAIDSREPTAVRIERRDGMVIDLLTIPLPDGATLVTLQDITDTTHVERALRERNEALETADSIKIKFVHHVSYELRSPLTNIIGFSNLLSNPLFGPLTAKQREYIGYISASTNALLAIINNILDLASIDAGAVTLNLTNVDIRMSMEAAAEGVRDRLVKNNIRLAIPTPPTIGHFIADERRLRQVLFNLLSNAIGFSPAGETVTLMAERTPGAIVFTVTDRGPGIAPAAQDKVFNWFETDPQGSEHRGSGLGLSLVRSFVELHDGSVSIDSTPGRGTVITCTFPTGRETAQENSQNAA